MVEEAEKSGELKKDDTIIELTSGNTGIGLAAIAAAKGYKFRVYIQDQVSSERYQVIQAFGGETVKLSEVPEIVESFEKYGADFIEATKALQRHLKDEKNTGLPIRELILQIPMFTSEPQDLKYGRILTEKSIFLLPMWEQAVRFQEREII